ncbi:MAG: hypothetical protein AAGJ40_09545 [Planctomycetota bacterium]
MDDEFSCVEVDIRYFLAAICLGVFAIASFGLGCEDPGWLAGLLFYATTGFLVGYITVCGITVTNCESEE